MHRRHQQRTSKSRSKGYKLKLSPGLASQRTVKGWKTKHLRYKYGRLLPQHHAVDLPHDENLSERELLELRKERLDAIESAHAVPDKILEEAARELRRSKSEGTEDPKMAEFIAKARVARQRELRAKREEIDPDGAYDYSSGLFGGPDKYDRYGQILKPVYVQINPNPGPKKATRPAYITRQNARRAIERGFTQIDPTTGRGHRYISDSDIDSLITEIQRSHHEAFANDRQVAANNAKNLANRLAQQAQSEISRRGMSTEAMSIEQQARSEAGLSPSTPFGGTPESFITGGDIEGEVGTPEGARRKTKEGLEGDYQALVRQYTTEAGSIRPQGQAYANPHFLKNLHYRAPGRKEAGLDDLERQVNELKGKKKRTRGEDDLLRELEKQHTRARARYDALASEYYNRVATGKHIELTGYRSIPREQRLGGTLEAPTIDDLYRYYGHEDKRPEVGSVAASVGKLRAQGRFMKEQKKRQLKALKTGDLVHGWGDDKRTASDMNDALFSLSPNKKWKYRLNRSPADIERNPQKDRRHTKELDYADTKTRFHRGKRDRFGNLLSGEWDEVHEEHLVPKFHKTVNVTLGKREASLSKEQRDDKTVQEHIFIPVSGISQRSTKVIHGKEEADARREANKKAGRAEDDGISEERYTQRLVQLQGQDGTPRWYPATDTDIELRRKQGQPQTGAQAPSQAARVEDERYQKNIHVHYVPEHELSLKRKERDRLSFKIPAIKVGNTELLGERTATLGLNESTDRQKALNRALFSYSRANERINRDIESRQVAANETARLGQAAQTVLSDETRFGQLVKEHADKHGIPEDKARKEMESRFKSLAAAGVVAAGYSARKHIIKGYGPRWLNRHVDSIRGSHPDLDKWLTKHNAKFFTVDEALVRPTGERLANWRQMARHPLTDPDGNTMGVDWGRFRYRDFWIDEGTRRSRVLERQKHKIERVVRTQEWFEKNAYSDNWFTKQIVKRRDHLKKSKDYSDFLEKGGLLDEAQTLTEKIRDESSDRGLGQQANNLLAEIEHIRKRGSNSDSMQKRVSEWSGSLALDVPKGKHLEKVASEAPVGARFAHLPEAKLGELQRVLVNDSAGRKLAQVALDHRVFLTGAGIAGLAIGAHYAHHKYVESKKRPEDRIAYYNKILPPAFNVKLPHVRGTGYVNWANNTVTRELGVAGKKFPIPVQYGVSLQTHRIALRPMDRGYAPNAPIFGGIKFRGPAPGGSLYHSVLENPDAKYNRKRSFTPKHKQVSVLGKALPVYAQIDDRKRVQLSRTNPNRITQQDRENLVWAYKGTPQEDSVKNFYNRDEKLQDMFSDESEVTRIRRKKGTLEAKQFEDQLSALRRRRSETVMDTETDADVLMSDRQAFDTGRYGPQFEVGASAQREDEAFRRRRQKWEDTGVEWR